MARTRLARTLLISIAGLVLLSSSAVAWDRSPRWKRGLAKKFSPSSLASVRSNPVVYLGKKISFEAFYAGRGDLYRPFFTPFTKQDYINIQVWDVSSKLWLHKERRDGFLFLYLLREQEDEVNAVEKLPRFKAVRIFGEVAAVHENVAWIKVHHIEASPRRSYTEKGLKHIELGFKQKDVDSEFAATSFEKALETDPPLSAKAAVNRELGIAYFRLKKFGKAKDALKDAVQHAGKDMELFLRLGQTLLKLGEYKDSAIQLENVIDLEPSLAEAHASLGLAYGHMERYQKGLRACRDALKLAPHYAVAYRNMGKIYWMNSELDKAVKTYQQAILSQASEPLYHKELGDIYMQLGQFKPAADEYGNVITLNETAEAYVLRAGAYAALTKSKESIADYESAMQIGPDYLPGFKGAVKAYVAAGMLQEAKGALERVRELDPKDASALGQLADIYRRLNELDKCVSTYRAAVSLDPNYVDGWVNLMILLPNLPENADLDAGIEAGETALRIDPANAKALYWLGKYYHKKGDLVQASRKLEAGLKADPDNSAARELLGIIYMQHGSDRRAEAELRKVVEAAPQRLYAKNNLAFLLASGEAKEQVLREALDLATQAYAGSKGNPDFMDTLGFVKYRLGEYVEGRQLVDKAVRAEETAVRLYHLALFDIKAGFDDRAKKTLSKARGMIKAPRGDKLAEKLRGQIDRALSNLKRRRRRAPVVQEFGEEGPDAAP